VIRSLKRWPERRGNSASCTVGLAGRHFWPYWTKFWTHFFTNIGIFFWVICLLSVASHDQCFSKRIWIMMARKSAKSVRIFVEMTHIKNRGVTFWPKRIGQLFLTPWSGHEFGQISWPLHSVGNICLILLGPNVTPWSLMCSISTNILTVLANFLGS